MTRLRGKPVTACATNYDLMLQEYTRIIYTCVNCYVHIVLSVLCAMLSAKARASINIRIGIIILSFKSDIILYKTPASLK